MILIYDDNGQPCAEVETAAREVAANMGMDFREGKITECPTCGHYACVCQILATHGKYCPFRIAVCGSVAIECEHGYDVCPVCDPCTCT